MVKSDLSEVGYILHRVVQKDLFETKITKLKNEEQEFIIRRPQEKSF